MVTDRTNLEYYDRNVLGIVAPATPNDPVNKPAHYNAGKVETIDYILQVAELYPGNEAALVGNVIKYISRAPLKGAKRQDLEKARWYLGKLLEITP